MAADSRMPLRGDKSMAKGRNSNIEILRIIAMLMIVLDHYSSHGLFGLGSVLEYSVNRYIANIAFQGKIGNALFVLISGYYMCVSRITMRKLFRIWAETAFYGLSFWAIFYAGSKMGGALCSSTQSIFTLDGRSYSNR